jgi:hypothetical protein
VATSVVLACSSRYLFNGRTGSPSFPPWPARVIVAIVVVAAGGTTSCPPSLLFLKIEETVRRRSFSQTPSTAIAIPTSTSTTHVCRRRRGGGGDVWGSFNFNFNFVVHPVQGSLNPFGPLTEELTSSGGGHTRLESTLLLDLIVVDTNAFDGR